LLRLYHVRLMSHPGFQLDRVLFNENHPAVLYHSNSVIFILQTQRFVIK
jgi:hypothetical protein